VTTESADPAARPAPSEPAPPVRGVVRLAPLTASMARGRASVPGALDPRLRSAPKYLAPPPLPRPPDGPRRPRSLGSLERLELWSGRRPDAGPDPSAPAPAPNDSVSVNEKAHPAEDARPDGARATPDAAPRRSRAGRIAVPLAAALLAGFVGATGYLMIREPSATDDVGRWTGTPPAVAKSDAAPYAVDAGAPDPFRTTAPALTGVPTRLKVPAVGIDTPLESLAIGADGELVPPTDFGRAGWYADGTRPGDTGPAVIAGHVDSKRGPAVFYDLREITEGDRIEVVRGGSTVRFTVVSTAWYPKNEFPTDEVYGPTPDRQLRLITCGGVFDQSLRSYRDNLVVYAVAG
jgi:sortase (surface protein transpeptidase)